ncbi:MAG: DUF5683 domain-containing protein [Longimicrobiales bacterium]
MKKSLLLALCLLFSSQTLGFAQQTAQDSVVRTDSVRRVSPGTAFYRSLLIPGWGQASVGSYLRGGAFVVLQGTSAYMMLKTMSRLTEARQLETSRVAAASDSLRTLMLQNPTDSMRLADTLVFRAAVDSTAGVRRARGLIDSRREQRQDWITYTIVLTLASGIDAFVSAHLADFPATIEATPRVGGGANLEFRVPLGKVRR